MKKFSKKLVSLITAAVVTSGFLGTSLPAHAAIAPTNTSLQQGLEKLTATSEPVGGMYATNPTGVGKNKTITIDGSFSDWSDDMLVAQGVANDEARTFNGSHEYPVYDDYALYASWDDTNLYVGWQFANPNDVTCGQNGVGTNEAKPYNADMPQIIALDIDPSLEGSSLLADGKYIWGKSVDYSNGIDTLLYFSSKTGAVNNGPGVGTGSSGLFKVNKSTGKYSYDPADCTLFKAEGIKYASADGFLPKTMMGINGVASLGVDALYSASSSWTDLLKTAHKTSLDTFYEMAIPLKSLGIDKNYIETNGIGLMHVSAYGSSGTNCLPHDKVVLDSATLPYGPDTSTSHEKEDLDVISVPPARVGKSSGPIVPTPTISSLASDKLSPQYNNTTINFSTVASGGTGALTYQYKVGSSIVQAYSSNSSFAWTPSTVGDYTIEVSVKDANGKTTTKTMNYTIDPGPITNPIVIGSFTTSKTSPQVAGTAISLNASATGGTGTLQYQYTVNNGSTTSTIKSYSSTTSATWTPQAGTYTLTLTVKDSNNSVQSQTKTFTITPVTTLAISKVTLSASNIYVGQPVTISGVGTGSGTLSYRFAVSDGITTKVIKEFSTAKTAVWTPTKAGTYKISVRLKDSTGKVVSKTISITVKKMEPLVINNLSTSLASPQKVGTTIKLSTSAASSTVGTTLQYKYWVNDPSGNWIALNSFGTSNYFNWVPKTAGMYLIWVDVKDSQGHLASQLITYYVKN